MSATPSNAAPAPALRSMLLMGLMMAGASTVDSLTANMLPITAKHFTGNITLIAFMVALNRICGFLVQPYTAWKSDSHHGARGRRRPFLLAAWPLTFGSVALLGLLPFLVPPEYHHATVVVALLFIVNLIMQACLDICYGCGDPMYGDTFASGNLGRAAGVRHIITSSAGGTMLFIFLPLADRHEIWPYVGSLVFVAIAWGVANFGIHEMIPGSLPRPQPYDPLRPLAELRNLQTRNVALVASAVLVTHALTEMLHALFVTETLGFSKAVLGYTTTAGFAVSLLCSYPVGWLADRVGPRVVLMVGFFLLALVEAAFVFWVNDLGSLYACLIGFKVAWLIVHVPIVALVFQNTPAERRGSIFAAVQMTRAAITSGATVIAGFLADITQSYRMCYVVAGLVCVVGFFGASRLTPVKRRTRPPALA